MKILKAIIPAALVCAVGLAAITGKSAFSQDALSGQAAASPQPQPLIYTQAAETPRRANSPNQALPTEAVGKAKLYIYRESSMVGMVGSPLITVNGSFAAVLKNGRYAEFDVQPGTVVVGATYSMQGMDPIDTFLALNKYSPSALIWPNCTADTKKPVCNWGGGSPSQRTNGCASVDWLHVEQVSAEDAKICAKELSPIATALDNWRDPHGKSKEFLLGMMLPTVMGSGLIVDSMGGAKGDVSAWLQACSLNPFPTRTEEEVSKLKADLKEGNSSNIWIRCKNDVASAYWLLAMHDSVRIQAEPEETYYVHWSSSGSGGKINLESEPSGEKAVHRLHPVKE